MRNLRLAGAASLLTLLAVEAGLRTLHFDASTTRPLSQLYEYDSELGWWQRPHARTRFAGADFDTAVATNGRRLREREDRGYARAGARPRLVLLGDSSLWGWGVQDHERASDLLAKRLSVDTIDMGQVGYGTDQEMLLFEREGVRYDADGVLLLFTGSNDLYENLGVGHKPYFRLEGGELRAANVPAPDRFRGPGRFLVRHSRLLSMLSQRWDVLVLRLRFREGRLDTLRDLGVSQERVMEGWPVTLALLDRLARDVRARGASFGVAVLDGAPFGMDRLGSACARMAVPFADCNPAFAAADPSATALRLKDGHLNAAGQRLLCDCLEPLARGLTAVPRAAARDGAPSPAPAAPAPLR